MSGVILKSVTCSLCLLNTLTSSTLGFSSLRSPLKKMNSTMKAIRIHSFGGPSVLKVENDVPRPIPSEGQILVRVHAAGINPVDAQMREQAFSFLPKLPLILGKEVAGDVVEVVDGNDSSSDHHYKPGDRVICCLPCDSGYAEYVVCNIADTLRLPSHVSYAEGAAIYVAYFSAYRGLITKLKIRKDEIVLVHGASGAVGMAAVQIAKAVGAVVVGTAGTDEGRQMVKDIGADYVVNHRDSSHLTQAIEMIPNCKGFDAILENKATKNLAMDLKSLAPNGRIAIVGAKESVTIDPRFLIRTEGYITGVKMSDISRTQWKEYTEAITSGMIDGWVKPVIAREYSMEEIQLAHEHLMQKHGHHGKLILKIL
ncbi:LOW QUALITY PROTEIN: quinone oxidoreductase-like [Homalodisca vitripennis]|uniref:LOW QUALITY PROTEIN: quinone oxidoreductase-like n=1 Tax=Homalodisca vitripennis TaxID=197043 RepID=UPI001EECBFAE|nr:LOW QUALITY PROTEIN: quinone oxidoreductase-like [Homalodisca vitripennis]